MRNKKLNESLSLEDLKDNAYCLTHIDGYNLFYSDDDDDKYSLLRIEDKKDLENGFLDKLVTFKSEEEAREWLKNHEEEAKAGEEDETSLFQLYDCYGFDIDEMIDSGFGSVKGTFEFLFENNKDEEEYFEESRKIKQLRDALRESILKRRKIKENILRRKFKNI